MHYAYLSVSDATSDAVTAKWTGLPMQKWLKCTYRASDVSEGNERRVAKLYHLKKGIRIVKCQIIDCSRICTDCCVKPEDSVLIVALDWYVWILRISCWIILMIHRRAFVPQWQLWVFEIILQFDEVLNSPETTSYKLFSSRANCVLVSESGVRRGKFIYTRIVYGWSNLQQWRIV